MTAQQQPTNLSMVKISRRQMAAGYALHWAGNNTRLFDGLGNTSKLPVPDVTNDHRGIRSLALVSVKIIKVKKKKIIHVE